MNCIRCGKQITAMVKRRFITDDGKIEVREIEIPRADATTCDYVFASDTKAYEPREVLTALVHNNRTRQKLAKIKETVTLYNNQDEPYSTKRKYPDEKIEKEDYDRHEVEGLSHAIEAFGSDLETVIVEQRSVEVQRTGIVCQDCYLPTDQVIWGLHKQP